MDNASTAVRCINHEYIVVEEKIKLMAAKIMRKRGVPRRKNIKEKSRHGPVNVRVLVYSFIVTIVLYAFMLFIERSVLLSEDYITVYVAQEDIDESTMLTADNISSYFVQAGRKAEWLPDSCVTDLTQLIKLYTVRGIAKNEIITTNMFSSSDIRITGIDEPIEVSLNANNLSQAVGGILREGDRINIWSVTEHNSNGISAVKAEKICDYAYVMRVFTQAGVQVKKSQPEEGTAMVVNIIIPGEKEEEFNVALEKGTLRIGRCMYEREKNIYGERKDYD